MQELLTTDGFYKFMTDFGYIGILLFFVTIDQLTPIPEEITLIGIGYLSFQGIFNPFLAILFAFAGLLLVDITYYWLARSGNRIIEKITGSKKDTALNWYTDKLKNHFGKTLLILCFIPRMRIVGPVMVGMLKMDFTKFLLFDAIGLMLFATLYVLLGVFLHDELSYLAADFGWMRHVMFIGGMLAGILLFYFIIHKKRTVEQLPTDEKKAP